MSRNKARLELDALERRFIEDARRGGIKMVPLRERSPEERTEYAEFLRKINIEGCERRLRMCCAAGKTDAAYNLRAYQQMIPEEILMSEERSEEYEHEKTMERLENNIKFERESRKIRHDIGARVAV